MAENDKTTTKKKVRRDRTEEILVAATKLLGEYGFRGATLARIAEEVGLTEPGVLHYFPSKVQLLQGVLEYHEQKEFQAYAGIIDQKRETPAELFVIIEGLVEQNEKMPGLIQLFTVLVSESIRNDHPSHDYFVERYRRAREMYVAEFLKLNEANLRPGVDFSELVVLILAVMDGLQIQWLLDPDKVDMLASFKLFTKMVVSYLER